MSEEEPTEALSSPPPPPSSESPAPPKRGRRLRAALIAIVVLVTSFVVYRVLGDGEFDRALAAHRAGDCGKAVDGYARVMGLYRFTGSGNDEGARRGSSECEAFLAAERVPSSDFAGVTRQYRAFLARHPTGPLTTLAESRLAQAYASWGEQQVQDGDYEGGIGKYHTAITEFAQTAGAGTAMAAVDELLDQGRTRSGKDGTACVAVEILESLLSNDLEVRSAKVPLALAYYHCARMESRHHDDALAADHLSSLIQDYRGHPLLPKARALLVDVRVDQYRAGDVEKLSPPQAVGSSVSGTVVVELQNSSPHELEILFSGPGSKSVTLGKCSSCKVYAKDEAPAFCPEVGPTVEITLEPGTYEVVLHDPDDPGTRNASGVWALSSGARYFNCQVLINR